MMQGEANSQLGFLWYGFKRALRHPKIFTEINPLGVIRAELDFRKYKKTIPDFIEVLSGENPTTSLGVPIWLRSELGRYPARQLLWGLVRALKPDNVVETGVGGGYGSTYILAALAANKKGHLWSIDSSEHFDPEYYDLPIDCPIGGMIPDQLKDRWTLLTGSSEKDLAPLLVSLPPIDLFLHDSLHDRKTMLNEFFTAWPHIRQGGVLMSHDICLPWLEFVDWTGHRRDYVVYQHYGGMKK